MGNDKKKLFWFKLGDIFTAASVLVLAVYIIASSGSTTEHPKKLILIHGTQTIDLSWKNNQIDLEKLINKKMIVEVQNGRARIVSSSCPDKICVHTGWVSECGHIAVCLPNSVALMIDCR
jgi:hypothetical protein